MAKDIPILERRISPIGIPTVQTSGRQTQALKRAAAQFKDIADQSFKKQQDLNQQILRNQELKFLNNSRTAINDLYQSNQSDPDTLRNSYASLKEGFLKDITDPQLIEELSFKFDVHSQSFLNKATANFAAVKNDETREESLKNMEILRRDGETLGSGLFADDDLMALESARTFQLLINEGKSTLNVKGSDGKPLFTADQRVKRSKELIDRTLFFGIKDNYNNAPDKETFLDRFEAGDITLKLPNEEGEIIEVEAKEAAGREMSEKLVSFFERDIAARARGEEKLIKKRDNIALVESVLTGDNLISSTSKEHRDAVNDHYEIFQAQMQALPPEQQTAAIASYVGKTGIYPDKLKTQMNAILDNGSDEQKVFAAEVIDQISLFNPSTINQISESQRARAKKISSSINAGISPERAVLMSEANVFRKETPEFKARAAFFKDEALEFDPDLLIQSEFVRQVSFLPFVGEDAGDEEFFPAGMIGEYDQLQRDFYVVHGLSAKEARETAMEKIRATWGKTRIGGVERWMKNAPSVVYGSEAGEEWIENQLVGELEELKQSFTEIPVTEGATSLDFLLGGLSTLLEPEAGKIDIERVRLEADPLTLKGDSIGYNIFVLDEGGTPDILLDANNQPLIFFPDFQETEEFRKQQERKERTLKRAQQTREALSIDEQAAEEEEFSKRFQIR